MYRGTEGQPLRDVGFDGRKRSEPGAAVIYAEAFGGERAEQGEVLRLRGHQLAVEAAQVGVAERRREQPETLARAPLDQRGDEQPVEQGRVAVRARAAAAVRSCTT